MRLTALSYTLFYGTDERQALDEGAEQFPRMQLDCTGERPPRSGGLVSAPQEPPNRHITNGAI